MVYSTVVNFHAIPTVALVQIDMDTAPRTVGEGLRSRFIKLLMTKCCYRAK